jgi:glycogen operon protein
MDGTDDNRSWNHGVEGPTDDPEITAVRMRQIRNFLTTMMLSHGTPMLLGGDEFGRTQGGNNNAWCQDSEISWFHWDFIPEQEELLAFTRRLIELRQEHTVFRRAAFLVGDDLEGSGLPDVWWFRADGHRMTQEDWDAGGQVLGVFLNGAEIPHRSPDGKPIRDDSFLLLVNGSGEDATFTLPNRRFGDRWVCSISTADPECTDEYDAVSEVTIISRSLKLLRRVS